MGGSCKHELDENE
ncbi:hypothetical protein A2U01_0097774, partial [Trifolium medium]|nr:hypothetical protein [Trifolium medium]